MGNSGAKQHSQKYKNQVRYLHPGCQERKSMHTLPIIGTDLTKLNEVLDSLGYGEDAKAVIKTAFYKHVSELAHAYYGGVMQTIPRCALPDLSWLNVWYTPGVSQISTTIRDNNERSFELTSRGSTVAVVSDSTRVLGDGDCTPPGGMGVMEGKAFLMKYLGGIDAVPLCMDSRDSAGVHVAERIIDFVRMVQPSFGAINLEDISQPNCFFVLDTLRTSCEIPVWHDDAQGTACVTLAGLYNALKLVNKTLDSVKVVLFGSGSANTTIARLLLLEGVQPERLVLIDKQGPLHVHRSDLAGDPRHYVQWELAQKTNTRLITTIESAMEQADVLIALSAPGPGIIKKSWIRSMAPEAIVFACANPVPEIWPHEAIEAGARIVATGRGDFPNQINNSLCFPGILKGVLLAQAKTITDTMAIRCAHSIAEYAEQKGLCENYIVPGMDDPVLFAKEAADVALQAQQEGLCRKQISWQEVFDRALMDIEQSQKSYALLLQEAYIKKIPESIVQEALSRSISSLKMHT